MLKVIGIPFVHLLARFVAAKLAFSIESSSRLPFFNTLICGVSVRENINGGRNNGASRFSLKRNRFQLEFLICFMHFMSYRNHLGSKIP